MPLANALNAWLAEQQAQLANYSSQIQNAIDQQDWDGLTALLVERQAYLEALLSPPPSEQHLSALKPLIEAVLAQDLQFQSTLSAQKQLAHAQQQDLTRNRKAIQLYSS